MKRILLLALTLTTCVISYNQTTWQVCVEDPASTTCPGKTGTFTPGNLVIQQGDMIQFTTTMVLLGGYSGTFHDIQFTGSPANNVMLLVSSDIFNQVTTVTTPPFNTPGVFPMECTNFNHCILSEYSCTGYSVTVQSACSVTASFTVANTTVCAGDIVNFTNTSTGGSTYTWHLDEFTYATTTNSVLSFGTQGSFAVELIADDGAGCLDSMTIMIDVDPASDAGADNSMSYCNISDSVDLNSLVTGDTGGAWQEITSSGQFNSTSGVFNYSGLTQQDYIFDYVVAGVGVCPNDTASMTITVNQEPDLTLNLGPTPIATSDSLFVDFTTSGVLPGAQYLWSFCDGNLQTDTLPFYYQWGTNGNYCVCVTVNNGNGCLEEFCDSTVAVFDDSGLKPAMEIQVEELNVYPNPTSDILNVDLKSFTGNYVLIITDMQGNEVFRSTVQGGTNYVVETSKFAKGAYSIGISALDFIASASFIVE